MSETSRNPNDKHYCGAKIKNGICMEPSMENGRCHLHGGLTPRIHPNHHAKFNAVKHGRYSASTKMKIRELKAELHQIDQILIELENNDAFNKKNENEKTETPFLKG